MPDGFAWRGPEWVDVAPDASSERQLWCAVIGRALEDAMGNVGGVTGTVARRRAMDEARDWFVRNGDDFRRVCDAAGYDSNQLRLRALRLIAGNGGPACSVPAACSEES